MRTQHSKFRFVDRYYFQVHNLLTILSNNFLFLHLKNRSKCYVSFCKLKDVPNLKSYDTSLQTSSQQKCIGNAVLTKCHSVNMCFNGIYAEFAPKNGCTNMQLCKIKNPTTGTTQQQNKYDENNNLSMIYHFAQP